MASFQIVIKKQKILNTGNWINCIMYAFQNVTLSADITVLNVINVVCAL